MRWGFLGAGRIAEVFAKALQRASGNQLVHVAARDAQRAHALAKRWAAPGASGDYRSVCADPNVDVVYVSTTHPFHYPHALMAIQAGKHVLVEKPMALNAEQCRQLVHAAAEHGVFFAEAMWMRTQPLFREVQRLVASGVIGDIVCVQATCAVLVEYEPSHRMFDPTNGGGCLLDLGVYPAAFAWAFLGQPQSVHVMGSLAATGVDQVVAMQWGYDTGATAQLYCSSVTSGPVRAQVLGRRGHISIEPPFTSAPTVAVIHPHGGPERVLQVPTDGYVHEIMEVARCIRAGLLESPLLPHEDSVGILEVLDAARSEMGVNYPQE